MLKIAMPNFWSDLKAIFLDSLFPYRCYFCSQEGEPVCNKCLTKLPRLETQQCIVCQKPNFLGLTHEKCKTKYTPEGIISIFPYHEVSRLIIEGKYNFIAKIFEILGSEIAEFLLAQGYTSMFNNFIVTPLPLSSSRLKWRGFNQSSILANVISAKLGLKFQETLVRKKHIKSQKDLPKAERSMNVAGCFAISAGQHPKNQKILLVDDVITTGSTLKEAVRTLKERDAGEIWCITVARD